MAATPESPTWSVAVRTTVAVPPRQKPLLLSQSRVAFVWGAWPSMSIPPTVMPSALLPALSNAGALVTLWFAPLSDRTCSDGQVATPERESVQSNVTVTAFVYQPLP